MSTALSADTPIWSPGSAASTARISDFARFLADRTGQNLADYRDLWQFSVDDPNAFWVAVADYFDVLATDLPAVALEDAAMPGARWFAGGRLNYAEHALRHRGAATAVIAANESGGVVEYSWDTLRGMVGAVQRWLAENGVAPGDRVVGYLPNSIHALASALAVTGMGAVWAGCGQDYGAAGMLARTAQLAPTVIIAADGYRWNGTVHDRRGEVAEICAALPTVRAVLRVPVVGRWTPNDASPAAVVGDWLDVVAAPREPQFLRVEFNDPLWMLFSSGTTGAPKGIVHSHGGVVLDHLKLLGLHLDLHPGDRFFWYTNTNWMMWNMVVSGLLVGATVVLYDGSPAFPDAARLWELAADHAVTALGVSPGYLAAGERAGIHPGRDLDLSALRMIGSTGAPLPAAAYHWVRDELGPAVQLASTSGGTDVVSGFAGSAPTTPVWAGEISAPMLGVDLQAWDDAGRSVVGEVGELVIASPMPSMPIAFWNDPDGSRYRDAYFDVYPGVWRHGDWVTVTDRGSVIISGRSDATLNRQGVRLGSADIYDIVEALPEVAEALVIGAELSNGEYWLPLFVVLADETILDERLREQIASAIRVHASPRHVPDDILAVPAIPHTRTGKKLEVPVKRLIQGRPLAAVTGVDTVDDPSALAYFERFARGRVDG